MSTAFDKRMRDDDVRTHTEGSAAQQRVVIDVAINEERLRVHETHLGMRVTLEGWLDSGQVGGPALPSKTFWIALPPNTAAGKAPTSRILRERVISHKGAVPAPVREHHHAGPPVLSGIMRASRVSEFYDVEKRTPRPLARLAGTSSIAAIPMAAVEINPVYTSADGSLALASQMEITLPLEQLPAQPVQPLSPLQSNRLVDLARTVAVNRDDMHIPRDIPVMVTQWDYVIITDDSTWDAAAKTPLAPIVPSIVGEFQSLASWKNALGLRARVVTIKDIAQSTASSGFKADFMTGAADLQQVIRRFLRWAHDTWGTAYVLLGGDQSIVPIRHLPIGSGWDVNLPTDLYYATLNPENDWKENEPIDLMAYDFSRLIPDVSVGRAPVTTSGQAQTFVNKVIGYETLAKSGNDLAQDWLHKALFVSTKWGGDYPVNIPRASAFPPQANHYYHPANAPYSIIALEDVETITQDPNASLTSLAEGCFTKVTGKTYYKIHVRPTYKNVQSVLLVTNAGTRTLAHNAGASGTASGWYYTDWFLTNDEPCRDDNGANYSTDWIIAYLQPGETPLRFLIKLTSALRIDYNLLCKFGVGNYRAIPYDMHAATGGRGWFFAKSSNDPSPSPLDASGEQIPTSWLVVYGNAQEVVPLQFVLDPTEEADTMGEQDTLRRELAASNPGWDIVSGLFPDLVDLPASNTAIEAQYYTRARLRAKLDAGQHIVSIGGHGNPWSTCAGGEGGDFDLTLADAVSNAPHWSVVFCNSCLTNRYTDDSLSRHLVLTNPSGGAVAYIGYLDEISIGLGHFVESKFFSDLSHSGVLGTAFDARVSMLVAGSGFDVNSRDVRYTIFMMGLLGDPALRVHGATPEYLIAENMTLARNTSGRIEVFYTRPDLRIYHLHQGDPPGSWTRSSTLDGWAKQMTVAANVDGRLEMAYIGTDDKVYHTWQTAPNGEWTQSFVLEGPAAQVEFASNADGRLELFGVGLDGGVYHLWQTAPNDGWTKWSRLGTTADRAKRIAVGRNKDGRLEVFAIGTDDGVYHVWQTYPNNGWSNWGRLGNAVDRAKSISVVNNPDGRLEVFAIGMDDGIYHIWQTSPNDGWSNWGRLGSAVDKAKCIAAGRNQDGRIEIFAVGTDDGIYHIWQTAPNNGWSAWGRLGTNADTGRALAVNSNPDGRLEVFPIGKNDRIYHAWQTMPNDGWSAFATLNG